MMICHFAPKRRKIIRFPARYCAVSQKAFGRNFFLQKNMGSIRFSQILPMEVKIAVKDTLI